MLIVFVVIFAIIKLIDKSRLGNIWRRQKYLSIWFYKVDEGIGGIWEQSEKTLGSFSQTVNN